jgi:hypothetical protein
MDAIARQRADKIRFIGFLSIAGPGIGPYANPIRGARLV